MTAEADHHRGKAGRQAGRHARTANGATAAQGSTLRGALVLKLPVPTVPRASAPRATRHGYAGRSHASAPGSQPTPLASYLFTHTPTCHHAYLLRDRQKGECRMQEAVKLAVLPIDLL